MNPNMDDINQKVKQWIEIAKEDALDAIESAEMVRDIINHIFSKLGFPI